jgi:hypothetical protein
VGAVFMFGFGVVWLVLGLFRGRRSPDWLYIALLLAGASLGSSIAILGARVSSIPRDIVPLSAQQLAVNRQIALHFYVIFGIELVAIFVATTLLSILRYADYILCGIALIVGVHFFPLAALFKMPFYYGTALAGCAIGLAGFLVEDAGLRQKMVGLSFGLLLWVTAAWITWIGLSASPRIVTLLVLPQV